MNRKEMIQTCEELLKIGGGEFLIPRALESAAFMLTMPEPFYHEIGRRDAPEGYTRVTIGKDGE